MKYEYANDSGKTKVLGENPVVVLESNPRHCIIAGKIQTGISKCVVVPVEWVNSSGI
jgi:hypothetical protein